MSRRRRERESSERAAEREGGRGPRKPAEERKDFLIQARVPRELDDVLKREAKRRRLSVSHLIRNVLEDTYKLVDGVISEVDNLVHDSVELSDRVRRDVTEVSRAIREARNQAAAPSRNAEREPYARRDERRAHTSYDEPNRSAYDNARGRDEREPYRRDEHNAAPPSRAYASAPSIEPPVRERSALAEEPPARIPISVPQPQPEPAPSAVAALARAEALAKFEASTADVYAWNPVVLHRPARCVRCMTALDRGQTGHLGLSQAPGAAPRWLCSDCVASL